MTAGDATRPDHHPARPRHEAAATPAPTLRRILVPLDGSGASEQALAHAAAVARRSGAALALVHVRTPADAEGPDAQPPAYPDGRLPDGLLPGAPDAGEAHVVTIEGMGPAAAMGDLLVAHARAVGADLIVMASRGRGGLGRALLGSVADAVVRHADVPVLLVRPSAHASPDAGGAGAARGDAPPYARVLLPLDGSPAAEEAVGHALAVAGVPGVHYLLLRVHPSPLTGPRPPGAPLFGGTDVAGADEELRGVGAGMAALGAMVTVIPARHGPAADAILAAAEEERAELVAMTTRGVGGVDRMIFGSTADAVVRRAPCPVLALRPRPPA